MSQLIGMESTVNVKCIAKFENEGKPLNVPFIAVYTRLTRKENKALQKRLAAMMRELREISKEIIQLESNDDIEDAERDTKREALESRIDELSETLIKEIRSYLKDIKKLKNSNQQTVDFSDELLTEMLESEGYFVALRDGLYKANGAYVEQKAKN